MFHIRSMTGKPGQDEIALCSSNWASSRGYFFRFNKNFIWCKENRFNLVKLRLWNDYIDWLLPGAVTKLARLKFKETGLSSLARTERGKDEARSNQHWFPFSNATQLRAQPCHVPSGWNSGWSSAWREGTCYMTLLVLITLESLACKNEWWV